MNNVKRCKADECDKVIRSHNQSGYCCKHYNLNYCVKRYNKPVKTFTRPCKKCGETFQPTGRWNKVCMSCLPENQRNRLLTLKKLKEERDGK